MPDTAITLKFGDGEHQFWLPMASIAEIERRCGDKSILLMHDEMGEALSHIPQDGSEGLSVADSRVFFVGGGAARLRDVYEVIRCGAIGGGASPLDAKTLVDSYVDGRPIAETLPVAWAILNAAIRGVSLKKKEVEPEVTSDPSPSEKASSSPTAAS